MIGLPWYSRLFGRLSIGKSTLAAYPELLSTQKLHEKQLRELDQSIRAIDSVSEAWRSRHKFYEPVPKPGEPIPEVSAIGRSAKVAIDIPTFPDAARPISTRRPRTSELKITTDTIRARMPLVLQHNRARRHR